MPGARSLNRLLPALRCPACRAALARDGGRLRCAAGHSFDVARQGYVNLVVGAGGSGTGDRAGMVAARERVLASGVLDGVADAVVHVARQHDPSDAQGIVLDLGGGTGFYLARVLDALPRRNGLVVDLSAPALRRAARAHRRSAAVGADVWRGLPLADGSVAVGLSVFGPRNRAELDRLLVPGGVLVVATPQQDHLRELVTGLGLISVDPDKQARLRTGLHGFAEIASTLVREQRSVDHAVALALAAMGPSAHHVSDTDLAARAAALPQSVDVTVAVRVAAYGRE